MHFNWAALAATLAFGGLTSAYAYPLLPTRPVPNVIAGPTDPSVAAIFYNPAALGGLKGWHLLGSGGASVQLGRIARSPVEGQAQDPMSFAFSNFDGFVGGTSDFGTDSFRGGFAVYTPYVDLSQFGATPVGYHNIELRSVTVVESVAAAYQFNRMISIGAAVNATQTWFDYRFFRDLAPELGSAGVDTPSRLCGAAACGLENPAARQELNVRSSTRSTVGISVGVLVRPVDRLWLAASYISRAFNASALDGDVDIVTNGPTPDTVRGNAKVLLNVPDVLYLGVRIEINPRSELELQARWIHYGARTQLDLRLQGGTLPALGADAPPPSLLLDRGLQDNGLIGASGRFRVGQRWTLSPSLIFETSAVRPGHVNAGAMDAPKFDVALTASVRPHRRVTLGGHIGATAYILGDVQSVFDSRLLTRCVDSGYALDACHGRNNGYALPSASGSYTLFTVHMGLSLGVGY